MYDSYCRSEKDSLYAETDSRACGDASLFAIRGNERAWEIAKEKFPNLCVECDRMLDEIEKEKND